MNDFVETAQGLVLEMLKLCKAFGDAESVFKSLLPRLAKGAELADTCRLSPIGSRKETDDSCESPILPCIQILPQYLISTETNFFRMLSVSAATNDESPFLLVDPDETVDEDPCKSVDLIVTDQEPIDVAPAHKKVHVYAVKDLALTQVHQNVTSTKTTNLTACFIKSLVFNTVDDEFSQKNSASEATVVFHALFMDPGEPTDLQNIVVSQGGLVHTVAVDTSVRVQADYDFAPTDVSSNKIIDENYGFAEQDSDVSAVSLTAFQSPAQAARPCFVPLEFELPSGSKQELNRMMLSSMYHNSIGYLFKSRQFRQLP
jgi:hypothetical protein